MRETDEFDDPKGNGLLDSIGLKAAFFIVLIALSFMVGLVWKIYAGSNNDSGQNIPIVRADTQEYKVRPDDPGGEEIKFKDSTIFADGDPDRRVENLLAEDTSEADIPRSQLFAGLNTDESPDLQEQALQGELQDTPTQQPMSDDEAQVLSYAQQAEEVVETLVEDGVDAVRIEEKAPEIVQPRLDTDLKEPSKVEALITPNPTPAPSLSPAPKPEPKVEEKPQPKPLAAPQQIAPAVTANGDYFVQLVSVKSNAAAESEWKNQVKKYGSLLSGQSYRVEKADLGAKGTYYRVQAGPMSKSSADTLCGSIKRQNPNGCLVKKK